MIVSSGVIETFGNNNITDINNSGTLTPVGSNNRSSAGTAALRLVYPCLPATSWLATSPRSRVAPASTRARSTPEGLAMNRTIIVAIGLALVATLSALPARAENARSFVSGAGSDSNPCSLAAPCRSFAGAIIQTAPGGEITVLDSAGYGAVTINQSVSITNPGGVEAGITTSASENAITIDATSAATVTLRGLTLD